MSADEIKEDLYDNIDGLYAAYGSCACGIFDEMIRLKVKSYFESFNLSEKMSILTDCYIKKYPKEAGYTDEDWTSFWQWANEFFELAIF